MLIDHIYVPSSLSNNLESMILTTDISDHLPCLTKINGCNKIVGEPITMEFRKLTEHNIRKIKNSLAPIDWTDLENLNADEGYDALINKITSAMDIIAPVQQKTVKPGRLSKEPWMSKGLMQSLIKCDKLYKKVCGLTEMHPKQTEYKRYRNVYNKLKRKAKQNYYKEQIEHYRHNSKKLWRFLRNITGKPNDKTCISDTFMINGNTVTDPNTIISNGFCKFYSTMGADLAKKSDPKQDI